MLPWSSAVNPTGEAFWVIDCTNVYLCRCVQQSYMAPCIPVPKLPMQASLGGHVGTGSVAARQSTSRADSASLHPTNTTGGDVLHQEGGASQAPSRSLCWGGERPPHNECICKKRLSAPHPPQPCPASTVIAPCQCAKTAQVLKLWD